MSAHRQINRVTKEYNDSAPPARRSRPSAHYPLSMQLPAEGVNAICISLPASSALPGAGRFFHRASSMMRRWGYGVGALRHLPTVQIVSVSTIAIAGPFDFVFIFCHRRRAWSPQNRCKYSVYTKQFVTTKTSKIYGFTWKLFLKTIIT